MPIHHSATGDQNYWPKKSSREKGEVFPQIYRRWFGGISGMLCAVTVYMIHRGVATMNNWLLLGCTLSNWISTDATCNKPPGCLIRGYHCSSHLLLFGGTTTTNQPGFINLGLILNPMLIQLWVYSHVHNLGHTPLARRSACDLLGFEVCVSPGKYDFSWNFRQADLDDNHIQIWKVPPQKRTGIQILTAISSDVAKWGRYNFRMSI